MRNLIFVLAAILVLGVPAPSQIATGGSFALEQSVIATGGDSSTETSGIFSLTGAIGQSITETSTLTPYKINSGFFTAAPLGPTAATVEVGGRVLRGDGYGISKARVTLTGTNGTNRTVLTSPLGYFRFDEVEVGQTYLISVASKSYQFSNNAQVLMILEEIDGIIFTAEPQHH